MTYKDFLKKMPKDSTYFIMCDTELLEVGKEYTKKDERTFWQKIIGSPRKEWEHLYLLEYTRVSKGAKVLVKKGTLYKHEQWGISAEKIQVIEIIK